MRILPDSMRCHLTCCVNGFIEVIPVTAHRITPKHLKKWRKSLGKEWQLSPMVPLLLIAMAVLIVTTPFLLFLLVPLWCWAAWKVGYCQHCEDLAALEEEEEYEAA